MLSALLLSAYTQLHPHPVPFTTPHCFVLSTQQLVGRPGFERPRDVTSAIQSVLGMLRLPRAALGISAASKGAVAGACGCAWV